METCGRTVLPDRSISIEQKMVEMPKSKCDILSNFQTLCFSVEFSLSFSSFHHFLFQDLLHRKPVKPSFVAPSQPLEKSLKEHIQKTAGLADWETGKEETKGSKKAGHKKDKKKKSASKESSPSDRRKSSSSK